MRNSFFFAFQARDNTVFHCRRQLFQMFTGSVHGRGIYLMKAFMDEVRFEEGGVVVRMRKSASQPAKKPSVKWDNLPLQSEIDRATDILRKHRSAAYKVSATPQRKGAQGIRWCEGIRRRASGNNSDSFLMSMCLASA